MYEERLYRNQMKTEDLEYFQVLDFETDLYIGIAKENMRLFLPDVILKNVRALREAIVAYDKSHPKFIRALTPLPLDDMALPIVKDLLEAGKKTGIGPMGAVAGAISKYVGEILSTYSKELIVENGGDLLIKTTKKRRIGLFTGDTTFKDLGMIIHGRENPLGICTSSGKMGHSLSFGKADTVTVLSEDIPLADAAATALCNRIKTPADIKKGMEWIQGIKAVEGALIIIEDQLGVWGKIELG